MDDILAKKNRHLFLEEKDNVGNSFIANVNKVAESADVWLALKDHEDEIATVSENIDNVNTVAENIDDVNTVADNMDDVNNVSDALDSNLLESWLEQLNASGNDYLLRISALGNRILTSRTAFNYAAVVTIQSDIAANATITLPDAMAYYVGSHMLLLSWNGTVCYRGEQYNEIGETDTWSTTITTLVPLKAGDKLEFRTVAVIPSDTQVITDGTNTPRSLADRFADIVNIKDFGAKGDGTTDDTVAIQAAINTAYAHGGGTVWIPEDMMCKCTSVIEGKAGVSIKCEPTSWLDFRGVDDLARTNTEALVGYYGTVGDPIYLEQTPTKGDNIFAVPDASVFSVGELIDISVNDYGKWVESEGQSEVTDGQVAEIIGVYTNTNHIAISEPLYEEYSVNDGARIRKIQPIENIIIDGLGIIGNGRPSDEDVNGEGGIKVFFGKNVQIKNCRLKHVDGRGIDVVECYRAIIDGNNIEHEPLGIHNDSGQVSYGIAYSGSMYVKISNNRVINPRSCIISSHHPRSSGYWCVSRHIDICNNVLTSNYGAISSTGWTLSHAAVGSHRDVEIVHVHDNNIVDCRFGVQVRTGQWLVENNVFDSCKCGIYPSQAYSDLAVKNNQFINCTSSINTGIFDASDLENNKNKGVILIDGNECIDCSQFGFNMPTVEGSKIIISNNRFLFINIDANNISSIGINGRSECEFINNYVYMRNDDGRFARIETSDYVGFYGNIIEYGEACTMAPIYIVTSTNYAIMNNIFKLKSRTQSAFVTPQSSIGVSSVVSGNIVV